MPDDDIAKEERKEVSNFLYVHFPFLSSSLVTIYLSI